MITRFLITWSRFAFSSWVGAAVLFVVVAVREVELGGFESPIRDQLALLRFPPYYAFGFTLVGSGLASLLLATFLGESNKSCSALKSCGCMRFPIFVALATIALIGVDYVWVYLPLESLITPPGSPKSPEFMSLHKASKYINMVHVGLAMVVAWRLNWPVAPRTASVDVDASPKVEA
ncbi:MAG: hypothetical protein KDA69_08020 [Planctomycetaceae bacterium]|nr:hypothetical protein [Planctomycetaceae bacterium]MCA9044250.1 hypothetical protein [Planctomycetaceae bacterium]